MKNFWVGLIVGITLFSATSVLANTFNVQAFPVLFIVNGEDKTPANHTLEVNGNEIPSALLSEGTTYVPLRYLANALGLNVTYNADKNSIYFEDNKGEIVNSSVNQEHSGALFTITQLLEDYKKKDADAVIRYFAEDGLLKEFKSIEEARQDIIEGMQEEQLIFYKITPIQQTDQQASFEVVMTFEQKEHYTITDTITMLKEADGTWKVAGY